MKQLLQTLIAEQRSLNDADSPDAVAQNLTAIFQRLIPGAAVDVMLDILSASNDLLPLIRTAVETRAAQTDETGCALAIPLLAEDELHALAYIQRELPLSETEVSLALSLAQNAATALNRLSWPAAPQIFRQLVENANVAIDVANQDGVLTYVNRAAAQMYGYPSPQSMIGLNVRDLYYYREEGEQAAVRTVRSQTEGDWLGEATHKYANGLPFPVELAIFALRDLKHETPTYGAIIQNVSENYRLLATLKEQTRRLESLNRVGTLLSSSLDRNRILEQAAEQLVQLLKVDHCGIALIDQSGYAADVVAEYPPSAAAGVKLPLKNNPVLDLRSTQDVFLTRDVAADERLDPLLREALQKVSVKSMLAIRLEVKGKVIGSIGLDSINRRRDFTDEDVDTCRTVANQIALAVENSDLYNQALVANSLKSQFLATISHELRTPLNAILGYTEMVLGGIYGHVTDKQQDRLQRVFANAQSLLELINDILDLSRIESGKMRLDPEPLDISPLIMSAVGNVVPEAEAKALQLMVDLPTLLPTVYADAARVRQVILNLLSNAIKFTREGVVTVVAYPLRIVNGAAAGGHPLPDVDLKDGDWLAIAVGDTGIGIAEDDTQIIFDAFRQVDGSSVREFAGTGMGLAITKDLIEMQGGKIWVESVLGQGSVFTFALPVITTES